MQPCLRLELESHRFHRTILTTRSCVPPCALVCSTSARATRSARSEARGGVPLACKRVRPSGHAASQRLRCPLERRSTGGSPLAKSVDGGGGAGACSRRDRNRLRWWVVAQQAPRHRQRTHLHRAACTLARLGTCGALLASAATAGAGQRSLATTAGWRAEHQHGMACGVGRSLDAEERSRCAEERSAECAYVRKVISNHSHTHCVHS